MDIEEFEDMFRNEIMPNIEEKENEGVGIPDYPLRRETWNDTMDSYINDGMLDESAGNYSLPDDLDNPY